jgi:TonB-dependent receptor
MNTKKGIKTGLKSGASKLVIGLIVPMMAVAGMASAQTPAPAAEDTVIVTGQRAQIKTAQKLKKDAEVIVDSITAVDIGALPDRSVSEALQRISGLTIQRTNENRDPARLASEGGAVNIRGLSWVRSETNGRDIFSAKSGRGLSFEDISADLMAGVDVFKNPSADMIEGGIGGTVNLRTRMPFDSKKPVLAFSTDINYGSIQKTGHQSSSAIISNRWHTGIGEVGAMLNVSVGEVGNRTDSLSLDKVQLITTTQGQKYVPNSIGWRTVDWKTKRTAADLALQWRPNEQWEFAFNALTAWVESKNTEFALGSYDGSLQGNANTPGNNYQYDSQGVFTKGTVVGAGYDADTRYGEDHKRTTDVSLNAKWYVNDKLSFVGDIQYVDSKANVLSMTAYTELETKPNITLDLTGDVPDIKVATPNSTADASKYYWAAAMDHIEQNEGHEWAARLDGRYDFDDSSWLKTFKFGVRTTDKTYITRQSGWNWGLLSHQYWSPPVGDPGYYPPVYITAAGYQGQSIYRTFNNFFDGEKSVPGNVWFPDPSVVNQGTGHAYSVLKSTETAGWGWTPLSTDWNSYSPGADNITAGVNTQHEKTAAVYGVARFETEALLNGRKIDGNFGLRVVQTKSDGEGFIVGTAPSAIVACGTNTPTVKVNCSAGYVNAVTFLGSGFKKSLSGDNNYTNTLPSFNARLHISDKWQLRFAASKAIVRPELYQLNPFTTLSADVTATTVVTGTAPNTVSTTTAVLNSLTGTGGNPDLMPIEANQYDITSEWYFAPTGSLTFALFKKDLKNYIYSGTTNETFTSGGVQTTFAVSRYTNGSSGKVSGFEVAYSQFYDFLPGALSGLGVQANYTHIDSSGGRNPVVNVFDGNQRVNADLNALPLEGMSPDSYNFAAMYEKYGVSARLAYNWRSDYLLTTSAANINAPVWSEAYGQLDGSIFYSLNAKFKIGIQGTNLTGETTYLDVNSLSNLAIKTRYNWVKTDRRVAVVLRGSF